MNEEALKDSHMLFVKTGYKGSLDDYKKLISTNEVALKDSHMLFVKTGYKGSLNDFKALVLPDQPSPKPKGYFEGMVDAYKGFSLGDKKLDSINIKIYELKKERTLLYKEIIEINNKKIEHHNFFDVSSYLILSVFVILFPLRYFYYAFKWSIKNYK